MSMPEAGWHHDGRFNLLDLVRMTEIEQSAELAAQSLALKLPDLGASLAAARNARNAAERVKP